MLRLTLSVLSLQLVSLPAVGSERPNFVVIFCDDLGYGDLGCFGHPTIRTPQIDRMAAEGQRWTNFYVGASVCTPSRAALLTGRLPIRNGMISDERRVLFPDSIGGLPANEVTIAELLRDAGYATMAVGKWHLGHLEEHLPLAHGFDSYYGVPYSNDMNRHRDFFKYKKQLLLDANYVPPIEYCSVPLIENSKTVELPANQETLTERYTQRAEHFITENRDQPFFLYLAYTMPHIPLFAGASHKGESRRGLYGDVVEEIDASVGRILETLRACELTSRTLVVFTSDNGPWLKMGLHGGTAGLLREGKGTTFEGGMRVPAVFYWPGVISPRVQIDMGATMDLLPTLSALAQVDVPDERVLDGYDLAPLLLGNESSSPRDQMFFWREEQLFAVRHGPWKAHFIIEGAEGKSAKRKYLDPPMLFNLELDPAESYDVAQYHPEVVKKLQQLAEEHIASVEPVVNQLKRKSPLSVTRK